NCKGISALFLMAATADLVARLESSPKWHHKPTGFRDAQAVPEHEQQQAPLAGLVTAAPGRLEQPFHYVAGQVPTPVVLGPATDPFLRVLRPVTILSRVGDGCQGQESWRVIL